MSASDIQDLFNKDPLHLTKEDLSEFVRYYREKRAQFAAGDIQAGSTKRLKKAESPAIKVNLDEILKDL